MGHATHIPSVLSKPSLHQSAVPAFCFSVPIDITIFSQCNSSHHCLIENKKTHVCLLSYVPIRTQADVMYCKWQLSEQVNTHSVNVLTKYSRQKKGIIHTFSLYEALSHSITYNFFNSGALVNYLPDSTMIELFIFRFINWRS